MAKPYRSRVDARNYHREANSAKRHKPARSGLVKVLVSAKDTVKAALGL